MRQVQWYRFQIQFFLLLFPNDDLFVVPAVHTVPTDRYVRNPRKMSIAMLKATT